MVIENLKNYPCKDRVSELTEGFLNGFKLHCLIWVQYRRVKFVKYFGKGLNGPTILPKSISFCTLALSSSLC
jgi:hypothetical protein